MDGRVQSGVGLLLLLGCAWAIGENRARANLRDVAVGVALQLLLAAAALELPPVARLFSLADRLVDALRSASEAGTGLVFGYLGGAALPFEEKAPGASFVLAFRALPIVLLVGALSALLTYWRILPVIVRAFSWVLERTLRVGGAVGLSTAANVFVGMVEAPLFIRPYLARLTRSELFVVMVGGMAGIAGTVLVLYATILEPIVPGAAGHLVVASIVSAPAAIVIARLMVPETDDPTPGSFMPQSEAGSAMEAIVAATQDAVGLLINIVAMLIVLVGLVHLADAAIGLLPDVAGAPLSLQRMLGWAMAPLAWLVGVPWSEAATAGQLLGTKTVLNELIAYVDLAHLPADALSPRSRLLMTYALCGFANAGSLGIMVGGLATMVPERRAEIVALGWRSVVGGTLATLATAATVGVFRG